MTFQNADPADPVLLILGWIAVIVFLLMLMIVWVIVRAESKRKTEATPARDPKSPLAPGVQSRALLEHSKDDQRVHPGRFAGTFQSFSWGACCIIAPFVAYAGYEHVQSTLPAFLQIPAYYYSTAVILSIVSPACLAVAWLRLIGFPWRRALLLFLVVPVGVLIIWYTTYILIYRFN